LVLILGVEISVESLFFEILVVRIVFAVSVSFFPLQLPGLLFCFFFFCGQSGGLSIDPVALVHPLPPCLLLPFPPFNLPATLPRASFFRVFWVLCAFPTQVHPPLAFVFSDHCPESLCTTLESFEIPLLFFSFRFNPVCFCLVSAPPSPPRHLRSLSVRHQDHLSAPLSVLRKTVGVNHGPSNGFPC